jgi:hypothetical protein
LFRHVQTADALDLSSSSGSNLSTSNSSATGGEDVSGYLMKEGNNLVKDWKKRWFVFTQMELRYYKKEGVCLPISFAIES